MEYCCSTREPSSIIIIPKTSNFGLKRGCVGDLKPSISVSCLGFCKHIQLNQPTIDVMVLQSAMSRLVVLSLVILSLGLLIHASPIAVSVPAVGSEIATLQERTRKCYAGSCFGGIEIVKLMLELEHAIKLRLRSLGNNHTTYMCSNISHYPIFCRQMPSNWRLRGRDPRNRSSLVCCD